MLKDRRSTSSTSKVYKICLDAKYCNFTVLLQKNLVVSNLEEMNFTFYDFVTVLIQFVEKSAPSHYNRNVLSYKFIGFIELYTI